MKIKKCNSCNLEKPITDFSKQKKGRHGVRGSCKACIKIAARTYYIANAEKINAISRKYYKTYPEKTKRYLEVNAERIKRVGGEYRIREKEKLKIKSKRYYKENKELIKLYGKAYREAHRERAKERSKAYRIANPGKVRNINKEYQRKQYRENVTFKLNRIMSGGMRSSLHGNKNRQVWLSLVPYTVEQLKKHLEKLFTGSMTWEKFLNGEIHIDHKIPKSIFNFSKAEHTDFNKCWALKNLQPMWALENIKKGNKITQHFQPSLLI